VAGFRLRASRWFKLLVLATVGIVAVGAIAFSLHVIPNGTNGSSSHITRASTSTAKIIRTDLTTSTEVTGTLGYGQMSSITFAALPTLPFGTQVAVFTSLAPLGTVVLRGQALYSVDLRPVPIIYGSTPLFRTLAVGVIGSDVTEVEQNLLALGYANSSNLIANGHFDSYDAAAVRRWQAALGVSQSGTIGAGDAVVVAGPVRVAVWHGTLGSSAQPGPIVEVTGATRSVELQLSTGLAFGLRVGDPASVLMPDGQTRVPGSVASIGSVAATSAAPNQPGGALGPTVTVTVTLGDQSSLPTLDQAPVDVYLTTSTVRNVLAVPVTALLALATGGYGIEVLEPNGTYTTLAVQAGVFSDNLVEIRGTGITAGMSVVVAGP
jgi:peptidoglycan hydrolase-like protein with peptidoglycan-binding domain